MLSTNSFCGNLFHENVLRTFWHIRRNWNSTSKVNKFAQQESMAGYYVQDVFWARRITLEPFGYKRPIKNKYLTHG